MHCGCLESSAGFWSTEPCALQMRGPGFQGPPYPTARDLDICSAGPGDLGFKAQLCPGRDHSQAGSQVEVWQVMTMLCKRCHGGGGVPKPR